MDRHKPVFVAEAYAPGIPEGWQLDYLKDRYGASVYALSVDDAGFELWTKGGRPELRPEPYGVKIETRKGEKLAWSYDPFARRLVVTGPLPEGEKRLDTLATPRADFAAASLLGRNPRPLDVRRRRARPTSSFPATPSPKRSPRVCRLATTISPSTSF